MHVFFHGFFFLFSMLANECSSRSETMTSNNVKWQDVTKKKKNIAKANKTITIDGF